MDDNLVFDDNSVYEIDPDCERKKRQFHEKKRKVKIKKNVQNPLEAKEYHSFCQLSFVLFVIIICLYTHEQRKI